MNDLTAQQEDMQYVKEQVLAKFPLLGVVMMSVPIVADNRVKTAQTDGQKIFYSPKFFSALSDKEKQFVIAHEVMHIAFNHILRSKGRNHKLWNIATDSVINQMLQNEQLPLVGKGVDIKEAINHSAEEMYDKLLKKQQQREQEKQQQNKGQQSQSGESGQSQSEGSGQSQSEGAGQSQSERSGQSQSEGADQSQSKGSGQSQGSQGQDSSDPQDTDWDDSGIDWDSEDEQAGHDSHDLWKEAVKQADRQEQENQQQPQQSSSQQNKQKDQHQPQPQQKDNHLSDESQDDFDKKDSEKNKGNDSQKKEPSVPKDETTDAYEKGFLDQNKEKRHEIVEQIRERLTKIKENFHQKNSGRTLGDVGETKKAVVNWKKLLAESLETEEDRWSYRRSNAENDYMVRLETMEGEDLPETEIMLDVSDSVDIKLLREFLRQLKPILKTSKLKVGCFAGEASDFKEIKTKTDIDHFEIASVEPGTNLDAPVRAFSDRKEVNKIVFTDGFPYLDMMPKPDLKNRNVIWLVYGNKNFHPCCGKVIQVSKKQILSCVQTPTLDRNER